MRAVGHAMAGQDLAYRSSMELVGARQVTDSLTAQDGEAEPTISGLTTGLIQRRRLSFTSPT
jgi:hypothetical protein